MVEIRVMAKDVLMKHVGTSGVVYVPKHWRGKRVVIVLEDV